MPGLLKFADAESEFSTAQFVIIGVPFDGTTTFRGGARFAPTAIREASKNIESYVFDADTDLKNVKIHDLGDLEEQGTALSVIENVEYYLNKILDDNKFPIMLGGEHTITIGAARALMHRNVSILFFDAHLDFRDQYLDTKYNHACVARRVVELIDTTKITAMGIRSVSQQEYDTAREKHYFYLSAYELQKLGIEKGLSIILNHVPTDKIYLSLDFDGFDPAYAPAVATPEPFGLTPWDLKYIISNIGKRLVGADIVEITPAYDHGNTAMLAARIVQEIIAFKER